MGVLKKQTVLFVGTVIFIALFLFILNQSNEEPQFDEASSLYPVQNGREANTLFVNNLINENENLPSPQNTQNMYTNTLLTNITTEPNLNRVWRPKGWTGLPLSLDNPTYFNPNDTNVVLHRKEFVKRLKSISKINWIKTEKDQEWEEMLQHYESLIGWNGIFDAVQQVQTELRFEIPSRLHFIGEVLARSAMITKNRHIIEITSRDMLHKAPMHAGVWVITKNLLDIYEQTGNHTALFDTIDDELCFFKYEDLMGNIWISCVHGVGHGIGQYYGVDRIAVGLDICAKHSDQQYQFACATGIFMEVGPQFPEKTFTPCDSNRFAAACFRFKVELSLNTFYDTKNHCSTQPTAYHTRACIWGFAQLNSKFPSPMAAYEVCEPYRPQSPTEQPAANHYAACFDGFLGNRYANVTDLTSEFCAALQPYETAYSICEYYCRISLNEFTFSQNEENEVFFYNYELLEELFDPSLLGKSAIWLPEWDVVKPALPVAPTRTHRHALPK